MNPEDPGDDALFHALRVSRAGRGSMTGFVWLNTRPTMTGCSGSPSRKSTSTSCPTRGSVIIPYPAAGPGLAHADPDRARRRLRSHGKLDEHAPEFVGA